jgi:uncharacterized protein with HEPN domain
MPSKNPAQRLQDIVDDIEAARQFIEEMDFRAFVADQKTPYAVVRALEIVSEARRRLPEDPRNLALDDQLESRCRRPQHLPARVRIH